MDLLSRGQLIDALMALVSSGDPERQLELAGRVETLLRSRGFADAVDAWAGELDRLRAVRDGQNATRPAGDD